MKKILIIILVCTTYKSYGQNHFVGAEAGIHWASIASKDFIEKPNYKTGFTGGLSYEYFLNKNVSVSAGIAYNSRGYATKVMADTAGNLLEKEVKAKNKFDYVTLPLKLGFSYGKKLFGFGKVGIIPAILLSAQTITPLIDVNGNIIENQTEKFTNKVRKMDIAGIVEIGGGYNITDRCRVKVSLSYQHSFSSLTTDNYFPNSAIRNRGITLALGLAWAITNQPLDDDNE
jgi:hypothetical protein